MTVLACLRPLSLYRSQFLGSHVLVQIFNILDRQVFRQSIGHYIISDKTSDNDEAAGAKGQKV